MKKGSLLIYCAEFPAIDPNVVYEHYEISTISNWVFPSVTAKNRELIETFGVQIQLRDEVYDFIKMKFDFRMKDTPTIVSDTAMELRITDGDKYAIIGKDKIWHYMREKINPYYLVPYSNPVCLGTNTTVHDYLIEDFLIQKGVLVDFGAHYLLSAEQIAAIEKLVVGLNLKQYYDCENPNIFAYFSD